MHWIIDGYNLILTDRKLAKVARNNLEAARDGLFLEITLSSRLKGEDVFLVFDGRSGNPNMKAASGVQVIFSQHPESADDIIKGMIGNYRKRRSILVVSNDRSIANYAKECGARVVGSKDFLSMIRAKRERNEEKSISEKPPLPSKPDPELLKLFKEEKNET